MELDSISIESGDEVRPDQHEIEEVEAAERNGSSERGGDAATQGEDGPRRKRRRGRRGGRRHRRRREGEAVIPATPTPPATMDTEVIEPPPVVTVKRAEATPPPDRPAPAERDRPREGRGGGRPRRGREGRGRGRVERDEIEAHAADEHLDDEADSADADITIGPAEDDSVSYHDEVRDAELFPADDAAAADAAEPATDEDDSVAPAAVSAVIEESADPRSTALKGKPEMLINVADPDECRIALIVGGRLEELDMERSSAASHVGNIYKGRVTNVEPSIQAAFVDFGLPFHGFLHISDLHPQYFPSNRENEQVGRKTPRRDRPPIQRCLRRGQEVIVQITKEGIGTKGPTMTTYLSLPGRFLVMMPGMAQLGVSRKVEDDEQRRKARTALATLKPPPDLGFIVRTAGVDRTRRELQHDLNYLVRLWRMIQKRIESQRAPCELYRESDLVIRTIRDVYSSEISRVVVDDEAVARKVAEFLAIANPRGTDRVVWYNGREPLFHLYGLETEIEKLHSRHVDLPCGGSLVIDPTEALVAIDVNSGRFRVQNDAEETARRVNLEAAAEIARQLRLRDLGGLIICDFIDMRIEKHRREVEKTLKDGLKDHKERAKLLRMSKFGIIEMTRQRQRPSFSRAIYMDCPHCVGSGLVKTVDSMTLDVLRVIQLAAHREGINLVDVRVSSPVAANLLNRRRHVIARLEAETGKTITISADAGFGPDQVNYACVDRRGREIPLSLIAPAAPPGPGMKPHPLHPAAERAPSTQAPPPPRPRDLPPPEPMPRERPRSAAAEAPLRPAVAPAPRPPVRSAPPAATSRSVPAAPPRPAAVGSQPPALGRPRDFTDGLELGEQRAPAPANARPSEPRPPVPPTARPAAPRPVAPPRLPPSPVVGPDFAAGIFVESPPPSATAGADERPAAGRKKSGARKPARDPGVRKPAARRKKKSE